VTVSQAATVHELYEADPRVSRSTLFRPAMNVGRSPPLLDRQSFTGRHGEYSSTNGVLNRWRAPVRTRGATCGRGHQGGVRDGTAASSAARRIAM